MSHALSEETNFVFFFAEADETRFLIQENDQLSIYTIQAKELQANINDDNYEEMKGRAEIIIKPYWSSPKLEFNAEDVKKKSNYPLFGEFHSAISIIDRNDK